MDGSFLFPFSPPITTRNWASCPIGQERWVIGFPLPSPLFPHPKLASRTYCGGTIISMTLLAEFSAVILKHTTPQPVAKVTRLQRMNIVGHTAEGKKGVSQLFGRLSPLFLAATAGGRKAHRRSIEMYQFPK